MKVKTDELKVIHRTDANIGTVPNIMQTSHVKKEMVSQGSTAHNLPGASAHPILRMTDDSFRDTKVSELMSAYGEADGGGTCANDFGNSLVKRWRNTRKKYCAERSNSKARIDCYLVQQTRHHGGGDNLCVMHNVSVNMGLFGDDGVVRPVVERYAATRHYEQPYVHFPKGFVQGDCSPDMSEWTPGHMPGWNADWTIGAFSEVSSAQKLCDEWVAHPVLIVQRDTFANFFHDRYK